MKQKYSYNIGKIFSAHYKLIFEKIKDSIENMFFKERPSTCCSALTEIENKATNKLLLYLSFVSFAEEQNYSVFNLCDYFTWWCVNVLYQKSS